MTPDELITMARLATFDNLPDQNTWEDKQYLSALNEARAYLYGKCPEARVTAAVGLTGYTPLEESAIADEMTEDSVYLPFYVEYMVFRFFDSGSRDTANRQKALDHKAGYMQALSRLTGGG